MRLLPILVALTSTNVAQAAHPMQMPSDKAKAFDLPGTALGAYWRNDYQAAITIGLAEVGRCLDADPSGALCLNLLNKVAEITRQHDYRSGENAAAELAIKLIRRTPGQHELELASALTNWGMSKSSAGDIAAMAAMFEEALEIRLRVLGEHHWLTLNSMNNLGSAWDKLGRLVEAEGLFRKCLLLREQTQGLDGASIASVTHNLAVNLVAQRKFAEAETFARRAVAIRKKERDTTRMLRAQFVLARALRGQKKYDQAQLELKTAGPGFVRIIETWTASGTLSRAADVPRLYFRERIALAWELSRR